MPNYIYPVLFLLYLVAAFGARAAGFCYLKNSLAGTNKLVLFLIVFTVSGFFLSEFLYLGSPGGLNNAVWFSVQALVGAWLLLGLLLIKVQRKYGRKRYLAAAAICAVLAMPTTVQFLILRYDHNYLLFDNDALAVVSYLEDIPPDSVVLHPLNLQGPSLASNFAGRASVLNMFRSFVKNSYDFQQRFSDVNRFFKATSGNATRKRILRKYGVDYVYASTRFRSILENLTALELMHANDRYVLYRAK